MKICILQPDYSTSGVDYKNYDPPRNLQNWLPDHDVDHVFLNKLSTYKQLKELSKQGYDIFVNLCEAYLEWDIPSIDVIHSLELLNLPYTGPTLDLYDPSKEVMKYVASIAGIATPEYRLVNSLGDLNELSQDLRFPLFSKPAKAGDSLGIDDHSLAYDEKSLLQKVKSLLEEYGQVLVEEYIPGREFTVLVAADAKDDRKCVAFRPVEYLFPEDAPFKTYKLKTSDLHPERNVVCNDEGLERKLKKAACTFFREFGGKGYARIDFRVNPKGKIYFLEVNFACSVFYGGGYEGSADYILYNDPAGHKGFLQMIIEEGISRHRSKQKKYYLRKSASSGYGIYAVRKLRKGEVVFRGEEKHQRIVSGAHVRKHWNAHDKELFRKYAYPAGDGIYILWDTDPGEWAPQNHSCVPNTQFDGLNVVALREVQPDEELTLDYARFMHPDMEAFECQCGELGCRKWISAQTLSKESVH
ncbi:MAG: SET domain-containing protein-lysine N-methyltransferase [Saprospiraceae bacterium]|nr:SET domain-containing protein-lysine N-methyltransferase [Saprospiraceae bacterium]MBP9210389.1 SET domain-containing protein-lysine N-methyltransferase [Saprospiraceae bacterium]